MPQMALFDALHGARQMEARCSLFEMNKLIHGACHTGTNELSAHSVHGDALWTSNCLLTCIHYYPGLVHDQAFV